MDEAFYHRGARLIGLAGLAGINIACAVIMTTPKAAANTGSLISVALVCTLVDFVVWNAAFWPSVIVDGRGIEVRNLLSVRRIPWPDVSEVSIRGGDAVIRLTDGRQAKPVIFRASVWDALFGSKKKRAFKAAVEAGLAADRTAPTAPTAPSDPAAAPPDPAAAAAVEPGFGPRLRIAVLWPALLASLIFIEVIAVIATRAK